MSQKLFAVAGVGEVLIVKRRGAKHLRLSFTASDQVRVSQPVWLPYSAGLQFVQAKADWINDHRAGRQSKILKDGDGIGKSFRLRFLHSPSLSPKTRLINQEVVVSCANPYDDPTVQAAARKAAERALKKDAERLLGIRLAQLAKKHGYRYKELKIKKLSSRWGSCSSDGKIALSIYLIQLPWELIDYVILHELAHTKHLNHSHAFWDQMKQTASSALDLRKQIKGYQPTVIATR
jgi:predicted metal-dependent hydrolase